MRNSIEQKVENHKTQCRDLAKRWRLNGQKIVEWRTAVLDDIATILISRAQWTGESGQCDGETALSKEAKQPGARKKDSAAIYR